jgi:hypothetical protein
MANSSPSLAHVVLSVKVVFLRVKVKPYGAKVSSRMGSRAGVGN